MPAVGLNPELLEADIIRIEGESPHLASVKVSFDYLPSEGVEELIIEGDFVFKDGRRLGVFESGQIVRSPYDQKPTLNHAPVPDATMDHSRHMAFHFKGDKNAMIRIEDNYHELHFHNYDKQGGCCSTESHHVEVRRGVIDPQQFSAADAYRAIAWSYYEQTGPFCSYFRVMGYATRAVGRRG